jgi:hypothetical protein
VRANNRDERRPVDLAATHVPCCMHGGSVCGVTRDVLQGGINAEDKGGTLRGAGCAHLPAQCTAHTTTKRGVRWTGQIHTYRGGRVMEGWSISTTRNTSLSGFRPLLATKLCSGEQARTVRAYLRI